MEQLPNNNPKEKNREGVFLDKNSMLKMAPGKTAEYLDELEKTDQLEEYLRDALKDDSLVAQLSYWEKWYTPDQQKLIDHIVHERFEKEGQDWELPLGLEKKFSDEELKLIFSNVMFIQPTFGCSRGCPLCGADAVRGVRDQIPTEQIENLYRKYGQELSRCRPVQYYASEPKDYPNYKEIYNFAEQYADYSPLITTANFSGEEWRAFLNSHADQTRLSLWGIKKPDLITEKIKVRAQEGKGKQQEKGMGVSRRDLDYKPEENDVLIGINHLRTGLIITPRGLYNFSPVMPSDQFPQGSIISPVEKIIAKSDLVEDKDLDMQLLLRQSIIQINHYEHDRFEWLIGNVIKKRYRKEWDHPPYTALINFKDERTLALYDIDGSIKHLVNYDQENLGILIYADLCSDLFVWDHRGLTDEEIFKIKIHLLSERRPEVLTPTKKENNMIGWEFEMPKIGPIVVLRIDESEKNHGMFLIIARKKSDIKNFEKL